MYSPYSRSSCSWWGKANLITLTVAFQALVHSPLVWTFLAGSDWPRDISVDPMHPRFSLGAEIWCNDENTALRLTAWPLMMLSHSEVGNLSSAVHEVWIHCLTTLKLWAKSWRIWCDSSHSVFPLHLASSSQLYQGILDLKTLHFLFEGLLRSFSLSERPGDWSHLDPFDSWLICETRSLMALSTAVDPCWLSSQSRFGCNPTCACLPHLSTEEVRASTLLRVFT